MSLQSGVHESKDVEMSGVKACDWGGGVSELVTIVMFASWRSFLGLGCEHPKHASMDAIRLAIVTIV